jgi:hypothetical protein
MNQNFARYFFIEIAKVEVLQSFLGKIYNHAEVSFASIVRCKP